MKDPLPPWAECLHLEEIDPLSTTTWPPCSILQLHIQTKPLFPRILLPACSHSVTPHSTCGLQNNCPQLCMESGDAWPALYLQVTERGSHPGRLPVPVWLLLLEGVGGKYMSARYFTHNLRYTHLTCGCTGLVVRVVALENPFSMLHPTIFINHTAPSMCDCCHQGARCSIPIFLQRYLLLGNYLVCSWQSNCLSTWIHQVHIQLADVFCRAPTKNLKNKFPDFSPDLYTKFLDHFWHFERRFIWRIKWQSQHFVDKNHGIKKEKRKRKEKRFPGFPWLFGKTKTNSWLSLTTYFSRFSLTFQIGGNPVLLWCLFCSDPQIMFACLNTSELHKYAYKWFPMTWYMIQYYHQIIPEWGLKYAYMKTNMHHITLHHKLP